MREELHRIMRQAGNVDQDFCGWMTVNKGKDVNTLVFPNLSSANSAYKLLLEMGVVETIGPIQMGLNKPIHFTDLSV